MKTVLKMSVNMLTLNLKIKRSDLDNICNVLLPDKGSIDASIKGVCTVF